MPTGQRELAECWGFGAGVWRKYEVAQFRIPVYGSPSRSIVETLRAVVTRKIVMSIPWVAYAERACDKMMAKWGCGVGFGGSRWGLRGARTRVSCARRRASERADCYGHGKHYQHLARYTRYDCYGLHGLRDRYDRYDRYAATTVAPLRPLRSLRRLPKRPNRIDLIGRDRNEDSSRSLVLLPSKLHVELDTSPDRAL